MGIGDWMILALLACWLAAAVSLLRRRRRRGGCTGCQGTCGSCRQDKCTAVKRENKSRCY
jgi:hypothetical protein